MKNCHVKVDWLIRSQILGIPIVSPYAPPCSMVICLMDERKFHNSLTLYHPYYRFFRYFDDLRMMLLTKKSDPKNGQTKLRFLEGTLSFNAGFSSILTVINYEFRLKNETPRYFLGNLLTLSQEICIIKPEKQLVWKNFIVCSSTHFLSASI